MTVTEVPYIGTSLITLSEWTAISEKLRQDKPDIDFDKLTPDEIMGIFLSKHPERKILHKTKTPIGRVPDEGTDYGKKLLTMIQLGVEAKELLDSSPHLAIDHSFSTEEITINSPGTHIRSFLEITDEITFVIGTHNNGQTTYVLAQKASRTPWNWLQFNAHELNTRKIPFGPGDFLIRDVDKVGKKEFWMNTDLASKTNTHFKNQFTNPWQPKGVNL